MCAKLAFLAALLSTVTLAADANNGLTAYKAADYKTAIPLLEAAAASSPKDPAIRAALLSALVYEGRVDQASDAADADTTDFPNSAEVIAARGEFAFYMGDMGQAENLFKAAVRLKNDTPRAYYGMYRLCYMASLYRTARLLCLQAHQMDPDDALITLAFMHYLVPERRKAALATFMPAHPWLFKNYARDKKTEDDVSGEINGRKVFELEGGPKETTLHLVYLRNSATLVRGVGLDISINGGRPIRLMLDTGASGILLTQSGVDKAGLNHLGSMEARGIGDKGPQNAFVTVADTCAIGSLKFKTCVFHGLEGKGRIAGQEDGLIGADFFSDYIIHLDFQKSLMHLVPQPDRPPNPQGYDRVIPSGEEGFTPVFRYGHELLISTKLNGKIWGLFLLDTGSGMSMIDSTFARLSTKIHGDQYMNVRGVDGYVKDVFEADKAELQFAHFRQSNLGLTAFNLNNSPDHDDFRMGGILGIPVLSMFRLTIDYRNGLVDFDYVFKRNSR